MGTVVNALVEPVAIDYKLIKELGIRESLWYQQERCIWRRTTISPVNNNATEIAEM